MLLCDIVAPLVCRPFRDRIATIYAQYNPQKLGDVDKLLPREHAPQRLQADAARDARGAAAV